MNSNNVVQKIWNLCNVLRGDGISYHEYISELTYLLFLKIAEETKTENLLPKDYRWQDLATYTGDNLLGFYQEMLTHLGAKAKSKVVKEIYAFPTTVFSHSENLKVVIEGLKKIDWHSISDDSLGQIYEGLLAKNSEDARSGAGQYFTPRPLVDCIIQVTKPRLGETIQDPAIGTGGFLISADHYIRAANDPSAYDKKSPLYQGMEIERGTYRLCLMNTFLHKMKADVVLGDALTTDAKALGRANVILANPPFGSKVGGARKSRSDIPFPTPNKQLEFLQHIYITLEPNGRGAVILPDNALFEDNAGKNIRQDLMNKCNLHTILRLPTGIFYSPGVKTNVLFFSRGKNNKDNTQAVWIYDMRTNMLPFGKRSPLTSDHFKDFIKCYGDDPNGQSKRIDQGEKSRFRCFKRRYIAENEDNLDILWLKDETTSPHESLPEPEELAVAAIAELEGAVTNLNIVLELLEMGESA
jgi:type I restriction enzyme M protein